MVHDLDKKRLLFATPGKDHQTVEAFALDLEARVGVEINRMRTAQYLISFPRRSVGRGNANGSCISALPPTCEGSFITYIRIHLY
ncbi:MAG: hypothetical protein JF606_24685 [Burkholderiales bacterium]|nr:hypothetical protein [Burkholderiales bacterium]